MNRWHPIKKRGPAAVFVDSLPRKCMYCRHCEDVAHFRSDAAKCRALAKHLKTEGVPLLLDEVLITLDGGDYCEVWEAMTEAQAHVHHHEETVTAYAQCWG